MPEKKYSPTACHLYDQFEVWALHRTELAIVYTDMAAAHHEALGRIAKLFALEGEEFLTLEMGATIRLDNILSIEVADAQR